MTLKELALEIGCSRATLDRVINNREGVGEERRKEILKQIEGRGYRPNVVGKMLAIQHRTVIGVILCADITPVENPLFHEIYAGMLKAVEILEKTGVSFMFRHIKSGKASEQITVINELVEVYRVSGIAISLEEKSEDLFETIRVHMNNGVKFISYFNINGAQNTEFQFPYEIGINQKREGNVAAGLMGKFLRGKGKVALLSGLEKNLVHQIRIDSAKEHLEQAYPGIRVVEVGRNTYPEDITMANVEKLLEDYPDLDGIIVSCGSAGYIVEMVQKLQKKDQLSIIAFDFTRQMEKDLRLGYFDALIGVNLERLGYTTIYAIYDYVFQNEITDDTLYVALQIKLKETVTPL